MRQQTELMQQILTNKMAQRMIDYISPVYGNSYVGLWIMQAIGVVVEEAYSTSVKLRGEGNPITSELLLDYHERHYGLPVDTTLTTEQRQERLRNKLLSRGPCNPVRLAAAVSAALNGAQVDVIENWKKNTIRVNIREVTGDLSPVHDVLERRKPAHLTCEVFVEIQTQTNTNVKMATAMTHSEQFQVEVMQ